MRGFGREGLLSVALAGATAALGLISSILIARLAGVEELGRFAFLQAIILMVLVPVQMGLPELVVREVASARQEVDAALAVAHSLLRWGSRVAWLLGSGALAGLVAYIFLTGEVQSTGSILLILAPILLLAPRMNLGASALRAMGEPISAQLPDKIIRPGTIIIAVGLMFIILPVHPARAEWLAVATVAGYGAAWGAVELMLRRRLSVRLAFPPALDAGRRRLLLSAAAALGAISAVQVVNTNLDFLALGLFADAEQTGIYRVASSLAAMGIAALLSINLVAGPRIAATRGVLDGKTSLGSIVGPTALFSVAISGLFLLLVLVSGKPLVTLLYGDAFASATVPLQVLAIGQLVSSAMGPVALTLSMLGHERSVLLAMILALVLKVVLILALVPAFGASGAALSTAVSLMVWNFALWRRARRVLKVDTSALEGVRHVRGQFA